MIRSIQETSERQTLNTMIPVGFEEYLSLRHPDIADRVLKNLRLLPSQTAQMMYIGYITQILEKGNSDFTQRISAIMNHQNSDSSSESTKIATNDAQVKMTANTAPEIAANDDHYEKAA